MKKLRIVVKVGSNLLIDKDKKINHTFISNFVRQVASLHNSGYEIIIVTSGAIGTGMNRLGFIRDTIKMAQKQASAAVGQPILMAEYEKVFSKYEIIISQLLLTRDDFTDRKRYLNLKNTILCLLENRCIPIINENDTIAIDEIKFGDNDTLSALVASKIEANLLIIMTDVKGFFSADPYKFRDAKFIPYIENIDITIEKMASKSRISSYGTGGMSSKLQAAKIATASGVEVDIVDGNIEDVLLKVVSGECPGTKFSPKIEKIDARKRWIAFGKKVNGSIYIDDGAVLALFERNKSLLASGIVSVEGNFNSGDAVKIKDLKGNEIAVGIVNFSSQILEKIKGKKSEEIKKIFPDSRFYEVIHKDNLVLIK